MKRVTSTMLRIGLCGALAGTSSLAAASSFQLWEQNASGVGDYHSGGAAEAADASTLWYNPAGMTRLKKPELAVGAVAIQYQAKVKGSVTDTTETFVNISSTAPVNKASKVFRPLPFAYYTMPLGQKWAAGFGVTSPFGLQTDYGTSTYLRYAATYSGLTTIDLIPGVAYQANQVISLGLGLDVMYARGAFNGVIGLPGVPDVPANAFDTPIRNAGDSWGLGYHFGMLFQFDPATRVGFAYHSQIVEHLQGHSTASGVLVSPDLSESEYTQTNNLKSTLTLPAWLMMSAYHDFNAKWAGLASATYTWWSSFERLKFHNVAYQPGYNVTTTVLENYSNTWNFALGLHYSPIEVLTFKMGAGYDVSPTNNADRNVQLPDATRFVLSGGLHYQAIKNLGVDLGYSHIFFHNGPINVTQVNTATGSAGTTTTAVTVHGSAQTYANIVGLQLTYDFD